MCAARGWPMMGPRYLQTGTTAEAAAAVAGAGPWLQRQPYIRAFAPGAHQRQSCARDSLASTAATKQALERPAPRPSRPSCPFHAIPFLLPHLAPQLLPATCTAYVSSPVSRWRNCMSLHDMQYCTQLTGRRAMRARDSAKKKRHYCTPATHGGDPPAAFYGQSHVNPELACLRCQSERTSHDRHGMAMGAPAA